MGPKGTDMKYDFAFIGAGSMGSAVAAGACGAFGAARVALCCAHPERTAAAAEKLGCPGLENAAACARDARFVVLGVKPHQIKGLLAGPVGSILAERRAAGEPAVLVSIAAGVTLATLTELTAPEQPLARVMPNSPAAIGRGVMLLVPGPGLSPGDAADLEKWLSACGMCMRIDEKHMDAATTVASCSPAYVYMFIEALADGGVRAGLSRADAVRMAAAAVEGSAAMALQSAAGPAALKDAVCSPGGSTIEGVAVLERSGFRGAVMEAVAAATARNRSLG